jgi:hypothetical protein
LTIARGSGGIIKPSSGQKNKTYWRYTEMKKLIASLLVLVFVATMVMAEVPAANAPQAVPSAFADVEGLDLNEVEEQNVIGKGPLAGAVGGAILGAVSGGVYESVRTAYRMVTKKEER